MGILFLVSCKKEEGLGGNSSIIGSINRDFYAPNAELIDQFPASKKDVFIRYGEGVGFDDKSETDEQGNFSFEFLRPGEYEVYTYSDCFDCLSGKEELIQKVSLSKKEDKEIQFNSAEIMDYDDGYCNISGVLMGQTYIGDFPVGDPFPLQEEEVYIVYGDEEVYFDRMDTDNRGNFLFRGLIPGDYHLFAFSECSTCSLSLETVNISVQVKSGDMELVTDTLFAQRR